ncbi:hypothetical protein DL770_010383 [Monosporascus sp. CRB-9-2]|nr:hypothetical protein DL770_010383 [Monosporascus sp. CRB-9-2]
MLESQIKSFTRVFIIVDALDECLDDPETNTRSRFLGSLHKLPENTHILYTSRPIDGLNRQIQGNRQAAISELVISASDEDLWKYFENRINSLEHLKQIVDQGRQRDDAFMQMVLNTIVERSQGMFLLAQLHMEFLATKCFTLEDFESGVRALPQTPGEVYKKALDQIRDQAGFKRQLAMDALAWLVFSQRAMSFAEIQHALALRPSDTTLPARRLVTKKDLTSACAGIVVVDQNTDAVRLAHYTAVEYLTRNKATIFVDCQSKLAEACLVYLCFEEFGRVAGSDIPGQLDERRRGYPFLGYAADHWGDHVCLGVEERIRGNVYKLAWEFLSNTQKLESACQVMSELRFQHEAHVSGLHVAAYFGLENLVRKAIRKEKDFALNAKTKRGETALHWAATYRQVQFLKLLIEQGAELNATDIAGRTALHNAVMNGHLPSVEVLLSSKGRLDLNLQDSQRWTPLRWAAAYGQTKIVEVLLAKGADVDAQDKDGWAALCWAAWRGHTRIVKQLVQHGASLERPSTVNSHWTLLSWAAREGQEALIELLIEKRLNLNTVDDEGRTALRWSVDYGRGRTAWLLIRAGADVNAADKKGNSPLHSAVNKCNESHDKSLIWLLLEHRAEINARTKLGLTALHMAASRGNSSVAWLLLEKGADPTQLDNNGRTALHCAVTEGHQEIARLLIRRAGMLVHIADEEERTALHVAASDGNLAIVKLLLGKGAKMNFRDREGYTPLHRAVFRQWHDVVNCLVVSGADVNKPNKKKWTPLHTAAFEGNMVDIDTIIHLGGADLMLRNRNGQTPWELAVSVPHNASLINALTTMFVNDEIPR